MSIEENLGDNVLSNSNNLSRVSKTNPDHDSHCKMETRQHMNGSSDESSPDFETDSCELVRRKKTSSSYALSQDLQNSSPSLLGRRKRKAERKNASNILKNESPKITTTVQPPKMSFNAFPSSPDFKKFKQGHKKQSDIGVIVNVTQKKTQKTQPENTADNDKLEIKDASHEEIDSIQWDTQMLRDVEKNSERKFESFSPYCKSGKNHVLKSNTDNVTLLQEKSRENINLNIDENLSSNNQSGNGFKTARGKTLQTPSKTALDRANLLFLGTEICDSEKSSPMPGFKSASGNQLKCPSIDSVNKIKNLFSDIESVESEAPLVNVEGGFTSAAGNQLKLPSKEALDRAKALYTEQSGISYNNIVNQHNQIHSSDHLDDFNSKTNENQMIQRRQASLTVGEEDIGGSMTKGFVTASGNKLKPPSKSSLMRINKLFSDNSDNDITELTGNFTKEKRESLSKADQSAKVGIGFTTASGNRMKIPSSESLNKAKEFFDAIEYNASEFNFGRTMSPSTSADNTSCQDYKLSGESMKTSFSTTGEGFTSGSGKKLSHPSRQALDHAKKLFESSIQGEILEIKSTDQNRFSTKCDSASGMLAKNAGISPRNDNSKTKLYFSSPKMMTHVPTKNVIKNETKHRTINNQSFKSPVIKSAPSKNADKVSNGRMSIGTDSRISIQQKEASVNSDDIQHLETIKKELAQLIISGKERNKIKPLALQVARVEEKIEIKTRLKKDWNSKRNNRQSYHGRLLKDKLDVENYKLKLTLLNIRNAMVQHSSLRETRCPINSHEYTNDSDNSFIQSHRFPMENNQQIDTSDINQLIMSMHISVGQDGAKIICKNDGTVGISEITASFITSPNVDPKLLLPTPEIWIHNHYRWIFWKLISLETRFPRTFNGPVFCPATILDQLRLRYDREVERCERSSLKMIYEGDGSASQGVVLCVARIDFLSAHDKILGEDSISVELTDGWYSISSILTRENPLKQHIVNEKIVVGTKLITYGAELLNMSQPCSPLEAQSYENMLNECNNILNIKESQKDEHESTACPRTGSLSDIMNKYPLLKLHPNSTRRVRWDTKLGYYHHSPTMVVSFSSLLNYGGLVSELCVEIVRQYPLVYKESNSSEINIENNLRPSFINEKVYERKLALKRIDKNKIAEEIYIEVQKEFEKNENKALHDKASSNRNTKGKKSRIFLSDKEIKDLCTGEDINDAVEESPDPSAIESLLSHDQCRMLQDFKQAQRENKISMMKGEIEKRIKEKLSQNGNQYESKSPNINGLKDNANTYIPILRLRVVDLFLPSKKRNPSKTFTGTIQMWRPTDEMLTILNEKRRFRFYNLIANIVRDGEVQFRTTKMTRFTELVNHKPNTKNVEIKSQEADKFEAIYRAIVDPRYHRRLSYIKDIVSNSNFNPEFREVDIVGILVQVGKNAGSLNQAISPLIERNTNSARMSINSPSIQQPFETVYVCDTSFNLLGIKFWKGLREYGFENLISLESNTVIKSPAGDASNPITILYFQNLQWRTFSSQEFVIKEENNSTTLLPTLFVTEQTKITKNPNVDEPSRLFKEMHAEIGNGFAVGLFIEQAQSRLSKLLLGERVKISSTPNSTSKHTLPPSTMCAMPPENKTPGKTPNATTGVNKVFKVPQQSPSTPLTSRSRNRTQIRALDYEDLLCKGNVENVPGSPAELQSKKTSEKIRALEKASMKLTYWNP